MTNKYLEVYYKRVVLNDIRIESQDYLGTKLKKVSVFKIVLLGVGVVIFLALVTVAGFLIFLPRPVPNSVRANVYKNFMGVYLAVYEGCLYICLYPSRFERIPKADPKTFQILTQTYYKDKYHVYAGDKIISNEPENFRLLENAGDDVFHFYAKDSKLVFSSGRVIPGADPMTFRLIRDDLFEDKSGYYYSRTPLIFYDPMIGQEIAIPKIDLEYISDKITSPTYDISNNILAYHIFLHKTTRDIYVISTKIDSFSLPPKATKLPIKNPVRLTPFYEWTTAESINEVRNYDNPLYLKDDDLFKYVLTLEGLDIEPISANSSFVRYCTGYYNENGKIYYFQKLVAEADTTTFKCRDIPQEISSHFNSAYAIDAQNVYFRGKPILGAKVQSFTVLANPDRHTATDAYDENNTYSYGANQSSSSYLNWLKQQPYAKEYKLVTFFNETKIKN